MKAPRLAILNTDWDTVTRPSELMHSDHVDKDASARLPEACIAVCRAFVNAGNSRLTAANTF